MDHTYPTLYRNVRSSFRRLQSVRKSRVGSKLEKKKFVDMMHIDDDSVIKEDGNNIRMNNFDQLSLDVNVGTIRNNDIMLQNKEHVQNINFQNNENGSNSNSTSRSGSRSNLSKNGSIGSHNGTSLDPKSSSDSLSGSGDSVSTVDSVSTKAMNVALPSYNQNKSPADGAYGNSISADADFTYSNERLPAAIDSSNSRPTDCKTKLSGSSSPVGEH